MAVSQVSAGGGDGVGQRHEGHLLHAGEARQAGVDQVVGQHLGVLGPEEGGAVLGQVDHLVGGREGGKHIERVWIHDEDGEPATRHRSGMD